MTPDLEREVREAVNILEKCFASNVQDLVQKASGNIDALLAVEELVTCYQTVVEQQRDYVRRCILVHFEREGEQRHVGTPGP